MRFLFIVLFFLLTFYAAGLIMLNSDSQTVSLIFIDSQEMHLGTVLGVGFLVSFLLGLLIGGSGWLSSSRKYKALQLAHNGVKAKLAQANQDLEYQTRKMNIFEDTIRADTKKPPKKSNKTFLGIPMNWKR